MFGWACGPIPGGEAIRLVCGDRSLAAPVWRVRRPDVDASLDVPDALLGFEIDLPPTIWRERSAAGEVALRVVVEGHTAGNEITLRCADIEALIDLAMQTEDMARRRALLARARLHLRGLGWAGAAASAPIPSLEPARAASSRADGALAATRTEPDGPPFPVQLEALDSLVVGGWAVGARPGAEVFEWMRDDGVRIDAPARRTPRHDVQSAAPGTPLASGFEVEIPGGIWTGAPLPEQLSLQLLVDGFPAGSPLPLVRASLPARWQATRSTDSDTVQRRHRLLVFEHLVETGGLGVLGAGEQATALQFAAQEGLLHLVDPAARAPAAGPQEDESSVHRPSPRRRLIELHRVATLASWTLHRLRRASPSWPLARAAASRLESFLTRRTGLFDEVTYRQQLRGRAAAGQAPLAPTGLSAAAAVRHYIARGAAESLLPNLLFDPRHYTARLPGGRPPEINPLLHYALVGRFAGLTPSAWFDESFYLSQSGAARRSGVAGLRHFLAVGWRKGLSPRINFQRANAAVQPVEIRAARARIDSRSTLLRYLLAALPPDSALPRDRPLPWWPVSSLEHIDFLAEAPWIEPIRRAASGASSTTNPVVDVLVPVYAGIQETLGCLHAVLCVRNDTAFELVVIDDTSPEPALSAHLRRLAAHGLITLHVNDENLGFVRTVNRGLALHAQRDVVILNSDTVVYDGWLDRLLAHRGDDSGDAAPQRRPVASVTPLSNNATLCSYPLAQAENWAPLEIAHDELDRLTAKVNAGVATPAPTGVGFCMVMTRAAIDAVGLLDADHFGRGYGEENDWCQRCERAGFSNLLAADVYVRHRGSVSFGSEADDRMQGVLATLEGLHPGYRERIAGFTRDDGLAAARARLDMARLVRADPRPRVLSVSHARGGGTERAEAERTRRWQTDGLAVVSLRPGARAGTISVFVPGALKLPNLRDLAATWPGAATARSTSIDLAELLAGLGIAAVMLHHLIDFPPGFKTALPAAAKRLGVPIDAMVHDYHAVCPRINLVDRSGLWCGELGVAQCERCIGDGDLPEPTSSIVDWRAESAALLAAARTIEVPDVDVAHRLLHYFPRLAPTVVPHEAPIAQRPAPPFRTTFSAAAPARVLAIGAISTIKGYQVLLDLAAYAAANQLPLRLELLGYSMDDPALAAAGARVHGRYDDADLASRIAAIDPDLIFVPSIWPETYCYVLSAGLASGRRNAAFDLGAQGRRLREHGGGLPLALALARDPGALAGVVLAFLQGAPTCASCPPPKIPS